METILNRHQWRSPDGRFSEQRLISQQVNPETMDQPGSQELPEGYTEVSSVLGEDPVALAGRVNIEERRRSESAHEAELRHIHILAEHEQVKIDKLKAESRLSNPSTIDHYLRSRNEELHRDVGLHMSVQFGVVKLSPWKGPRQPRRPRGVPVMPMPQGEVQGVEVQEVMPMPQSEGVFTLEQLEPQLVQEIQLLPVEFQRPVVLLAERMEIRERSVLIVLLEKLVRIGIGTFLSLPLFTPDGRLKKPGEGDVPAAVKQLLESLSPEERDVLERVVAICLDLKGIGALSPRPGKTESYPLDEESPALKAKILGMAKRFTEAKTEEDKLIAEGSLRMAGVDVDGSDLKNGKLTMLPTVGSARFVNLIVGLIQMGVGIFRKLGGKKTKIEKEMDDLQTGEKPKDPKEMTSKEREDELKKDRGAVAESLEKEKKLTSDITELEAKLKDDKLDEKTRDALTKRLGEVKKELSDLQAARAKMEQRIKALEEAQAVGVEPPKPTPEPQPQQQGQPAPAPQQQPAPAPQQSQQPPQSAPVTPPTLPPQVPPTSPTEQQKPELGVPETAETPIEYRTTGGQDLKELAPEQYRFIRQAEKSGLSIKKNEYPLWQRLQKDEKKDGSGFLCSELTFNGNKVLVESYIQETHGSHNKAIVEKIEELMANKQIDVYAMKAYEYSAWREGENITFSAKGENSNTSYTTFVEQLPSDSQTPKFIIKTKHRQTAALEVMCPFTIEKKVKAEAAVDKVIIIDSHGEHEIKVDVSAKKTETEINDLPKQTETAPERIYKTRGGEEFYDLTPDQRKIILEAEAQGIAFKNPTGSALSATGNTMIVFPGGREEQVQTHFSEGDHHVHNKKIVELLIRQTNLDPETGRLTTRVVFGKIEDYNGATSIVIGFHKGKREAALDVCRRIGLEGVIPETEFGTRLAIRRSKTLTAEGLKVLGDHPDIFSFVEPRLARRARLD